MDPSQIIIQADCRYVDKSSMIINSYYKFIGQAFFSKIQIKIENDTHDLLLQKMIFVLSNVNDTLRVACPILFCLIQHSKSLQTPACGQYIGLTHREPNILGKMIFEKVRLIPLSLFFCNMYRIKRGIRSPKREKKWEKPHFMHKNFQMETYVKHALQLT